jgi:hypothetical protein
VGVTLRYPAPRRDVDLTARPARASGGTVEFRVGSERVRVTRRTGTTFSVRAPAGASVRVDPRGARDRFGNTNGAGTVLR